MGRSLGATASSASQHPCALGQDYARCLAPKMQERRGFRSSTLHNLENCITPRGQPWTAAMAPPHGRDGLSARRIAVLWTFREPSLGRHVRRELLRNALLDCTPIIPATACHQRNDVETYSRFRLVRTNRA